MFKWLSDIPTADIVYMLILLITSILLGARYKHLSPNMHWLIVLSIAHLIAEVMADYIYFVQHKNNMIVYHAITIIEYITICLFFFHTFESETLRKWVQMSILVYLLFVMLFTWKLEPITEDNPLSFIMESTFVLFWCFSFFRETLTRSSGYRPESDPTFWVVVGLTFYFLGNFLILGGIDYFDKTAPTLAKKIYYTGYVFNYMLYTIISIVCIIPYHRIAHD
jgi:hypothetical protein